MSGRCRSIHTSTKGPHEPIIDMVIASFGDGDLLLAVHLKVDGDLALLHCEVGLVKAIDEPAADVTRLGMQLVTNISTPTGPLSWDIPHLVFQRLIVVHHDGDVDHGRLVPVALVEQVPQVLGDYSP